MMKLSFIYSFNLDFFCLKQLPVIILHAGLVLNFRAVVGRGKQTQKFYA